MDRRLLLASGLALLGAKAASAQPSGAAPYGGPSYGTPSDGAPSDPGRDYSRDQDRSRAPSDSNRPNYPTGQRIDTYSEDELANSVSDFFGVTAETAGAVIERAFKENGQPTGYIAGAEGAGAFAIGLRYGTGLLYMKNRATQKVFWQGPSVGWDFGGNASRVFTLCYNLQYPDMIYRRFPGLEGTAYFIGGLGVNYQRAEDVTLAPIRAGIGLRLGANAGYLAYSRRRHIIPL